MQREDIDDITRFFITDPDIVIVDESTTKQSVTIPASRDILAEIEQEKTAPHTVWFTDLTISPQTRYMRSIGRKIRFLISYLIVSTSVFFVLLGITNADSYYLVLSSYMNADDMAKKSDTIERHIDESHVTIFANEDAMTDTESGTLREDTVNQAFISDKQKKILELRYRHGSFAPAIDTFNVVNRPRDDIFSSKRLVPFEENLDINFDITPYENRIIIPRIDQNIPLVDVDPSQGFDLDHLENIFMDQLQKGIVRYPGTALPGEKGNAFIFGHSSNYPWMKGNYNHVFALLDNVVYGDEITVYYGQKKYTYIVREKHIIRPSDIRVVAHRDPNKKELTLMTCWPVGTTLKRLLVFAELKEVNPSVK